MDPNELRKLADEHASAIYGGKGVPAGEALKAPKALRHAADEIERLRADHEAAMVEAFETRCALNRAKADIEKLRGALEWYAEPEHLRWDDTACTLAQETLAKGDDSLDAWPPAKQMLAKLDK